MNVWFTADTHFNHRAMIENQWRPQYDTVQEMNDDLIERWNSVVRTGDTVWHLGDFAMGPMSQALETVPFLNGTKHLITGNHDRVWPGNRDSHKHQKVWIDAGFASVQAFARRRLDGRQVMLSHFPYQGDHVSEDRFDEYRLRDNGLWLLHGHVHAEWRIRDRVLNVGVDVQDFTPISIEEVADQIQKFEESADQKRGAASGDALGSRFPRSHDALRV